MERQTKEHADREAEIRQTIAAALTMIDGDRSPLELVAEIPMVESAIDEVVAERIAAARSQGLSWEAIAQRLGISRQAVHKRFGTKTKRRRRTGLRVEVRVERPKER